MITLTGKGVSSGIAIGPIARRQNASAPSPEYNITDTAAELARFKKAKAQAQNQLQEMQVRTKAAAGAETAAIFETHQLMLDDPDYVETITGLIQNEKINAEAAVQKTAQQFAAIFAHMEDAYMQARSADVRDISARVVRNLKGKTEQDWLTQPSLAAAKDLAPSETISLDPSKLLGFLTEEGTANSHTAILARTMGIPAVVAAGPFLEKLQPGMTAVIDGSSGKIYLDPDTETLKKFTAQAEAQQKQKQLLASLKGLPTETKSGHKVKLFANIGSPDDLPSVLQNDCEGIGLFRSEFLYLGRQSLPTEEEQFQAYKKVLTALPGKEVVIRTLDVGADKQADYLKMPPETNPALGCRAIRYCLTHPDIFKTQLRALLRAAVYGKALIMLPLITAAAEISQAKELLAKAAAELKAADIPHAEHLPLGIMIETPAAAIISGELAALADFFSIGTNDLTQYTLCLDRQNPHLEQFTDLHHPALLELIKLTVRQAHAHHLWVGICGELGADPTLAQFYLDLGVDELSVAPASLLPLRQKIRSLP